MTENTPSPARAEGASDYTPPSYDIVPEDQPIADAITSLDPLRDIGGSGRISGSINMPDAIPVTTLPPDARAEVEAKLQGVPESRRAAAEAQAVKDVLFARTGNTRLLTGLAADAPAWHMEMADIARDYRAAAQEFNRITEEMAEVARYDTVTGPDGKAQAKPVYAMSDTRQIAAAKQIAELDYRMNLLMDSDGNHGPEAQRRLSKALLESVGQAKAKQAELEEHREAEALADKMNREARIKAKAEALAKHRRNTL